MEGKVLHPKMEMAWSVDYKLLILCDGLIASHIFCQHSSYTQNKTLTDRFSEASYKIVYSELFHFRPPKKSYYDQLFFVYDFL